MSSAPCKAPKLVFFNNKVNTKVYVFCGHPFWNFRSPDQGEDTWIGNRVYIYIYTYIYIYIYILSSMFNEVGSKSSEFCSL